MLLTPEPSLHPESIFNLNDLAQVKGPHDCRAWCLSLSFLPSGHPFFHIHITSFLEDSSFSLFSVRRDYDEADLPCISRDGTEVQTSSLLPVYHDPVQMKTDQWETSFKKCATAVGETLLPLRLWVGSQPGALTAWEEQCGAETQRHRSYKPLLGVLGAATSDLIHTDYWIMCSFILFELTFCWLGLKVSWPLNYPSNFIPPCLHKLVIIFIINLKNWLH